MEGGKEVSYTLLILLKITQFYLETEKQTTES